MKGCTNVTQFWKAIRKFRPRRNSRGQNIKKDAWRQYFRELLSGSTGEQESEQRGPGGQRDESGEEGNGNI